MRPPAAWPARWSACSSPGNRVDPGTRARLELLLQSDITAVRDLGGQHGARHYRLHLPDGRAAFAKVADVRRTVHQEGNEAEPPAAARPSRQFQAGQGTQPGFAAEAAGLRWLAKAGAVPVPAVLGQDTTCLVIEWVAAGGPTPQAAAGFGRDLAALHKAGAARFGAPWPGEIAGLPLPNDQAESWPDWYATNRLLPYARIARDAGTLSGADVRLMESVAARISGSAGPAEPPSRIHGDCWSGNVLWAGGRGWLIDPAAHGGHRETDLAMLALFGAPYLDHILAAYQEVAPLADGWRARFPLHQLHPLLVHVCLFGAAYRNDALAAARAAASAG